MDFQLNFKETLINLNKLWGTYILLEKKLKDELCKCEVMEKNTFFQSLKANTL